MIEYVEEICEKLGLETEAVWYKGKNKKITITNEELIFYILCNKSIRSSVSRELGIGYTTYLKHINKAIPKGLTTKPHRLYFLELLNLKHCNICDSIKYLGYFYKRSNGNILSSCISCTKDQAKKGYSPELDSIRSSNRRAKRLQRTPSWTNIEAIKLFYKNRPKGYHVDHIIPLQGEKVSGLHVLENLQYLSPSENCRKGNKFNV